MTDLPTAARRALDALDDLISHIIDPGVEALGARQELAHALQRDGAAPVDEARAAALYAIHRFNVPENTPALPLRWRVIIGDSESMDGIAPVCPSTADTAGLHVIADYPGGPIQDDTGVYDCCPTPWIEAGHGEIAAYLVALLNADAAAGGERP